MRPRKTYSNLEWIPLSHQSSARILRAMTHCHVFFRNSEIWFFFLLLLPCFHAANYNYLRFTSFPYSLPESRHDHISYMSCIENSPRIFYLSCVRSVKLIHILCGWETSHLRANASHHFNHHVDICLYIIYCIYI